MLWCTVQLVETSIVIHTQILTNVMSIVGNSQERQRILYTNYPQDFVGSNINQI